MTERPEAPPEGKLIKAALAASGLSQRRAADLADLSEARWRQIVAGYQSVGGRPVPISGPDETLARMAHVVGVRPEELAAAGRPEAAEALRALDARQREAKASAPESGPRARLEERWHMVEGVLRAAREGLSPSEDDTLAGRVQVFFAQEPGGHRRERAAAPDADRETSAG
ncbi:helix-turn-helix transcriptional regulator [Actinacidiphila alni]|uniref:helix-turn-helix domain-containing protein n=1 Tax=Actinacidiphila alni TaxID=380248 RepID=UPI0033D1FBE8